MDIKKILEIIKWVFIVVACITILYGIYNLLLLLLPIVVNILTFPYMSYLDGDDYHIVAMYALIIYGPIMISIASCCFLSGFDE